MRELEGNIYNFGDFRLDKANKVLRNNGEIVALPLKAVELLCLLVENRNEVISKSEILDKVWGNSYVDEGVLTQNIHKLRKLFEEYGEKDLIKTVARRGYIFKYDKPQENSLTITRDYYEEIEIEEAGGDLYLPPKKSSRRFLWLFAALLGIFALAAAVFFQRGKSEKKDNREISISPPASAKSRLKTLAVLPFDSEDKKESSFAQSFTSDITTRIGSLNRFNVKPYFITANAKNIKSDFILRGNIAIKSDKFIIEANLRDINRNADIFTKSFEATQNNLIQLQDSIANEAANSILGTLPDGEKETLSKRLPTNFAAYETYQRGFELWRKRRDASAYFQKAIELDANFAKAYIGLASAKVFFPDEREATIQNLTKGLEIEPDLPEANAVIGFIKIFQEHNWPEAEIALKNALKSDETNVNAHHWMAIFHVAHGRLDEAKAEIRAAIELDEMNPTLLADLGLIHYFASEKAFAKQNCQEALKIEQGSEFAQKCLDDLARPMPDKSTALAEIKALKETNGYNLVFIKADPRFAGVRDEPGFKNALMKLGLE